MMLGIRNMGNNTSKQVANYLSGVKYSFHGIEKAVIAGFGPGEPRRQLYEDAVAYIQPYIKILLPEQISDSAIGCEFTGSPKAFGYKTKEEFLAHAKSKGYYHSGLKDAQVLFTDDVNASSSKMVAARKRGMRIVLYSEI
jgi:hypothetical protein